MPARRSLLIAEALAQVVGGGGWRRQALFFSPDTNHAVLGPSQLRGSRTRYYRKTHASDCIS